MSYFQYIYILLHKTCFTYHKPQYLSRLTAYLNQIKITWTKQYPLTNYLKQILRKLELEENKHIEIIKKKLVVNS